LSVGKKEHDWADVFDALYYHFINQHEEKLKHYYATSRNVAHWEHKSKENQRQLIKLAEDYLSQYINKGSAGENKRKIQFHIFLRKKKTKHLCITIYFRDSRFSMPPSFP